MLQHMCKSTGVTLLEELVVLKGTKVFLISVYFAGVLSLSHDGCFPCSSASGFLDLMIFNLFFIALFSRLALSCVEDGLTGSTRKPRSLNSLQ